MVGDGAPNNRLQRTAQGAAAELRCYPAEETARRGDEIHKREVRARVEAGDHGKVVAIDIETSAYFRATLLFHTSYVRQRG